MFDGGRSLVGWRSVRCHSHNKVLLLILLLIKAEMLGVVLVAFSCHRVIDHLDKVIAGILLLGLS